MRILCTFPGKHGDSLWAMPTVRAISEAAGQPVDLLMAPAYSSLLPLYRLQSYIGRAEAWPSWQVQNSAPMTPWSPFEETLHHEAINLDPTAYDAILHLGYRAWPTHPLPYYVEAIVRQEYPEIPMGPIDLQRPWITPPSLYRQIAVAGGFSDEYFELKYGLWQLLTRQSPPDEAWQSLSGTPGSRWSTEGCHWCASWEIAASLLQASQVFLGCCSALHVLACALGIPCVVMEPAEARWNPIFWPYGQDGPRVTLVTGTDGKPTWDARHVRETLQAALAHREDGDPS
jgi:hypothetical protein